MSFPGELAGRVRAELVCPRPERVLNLCAREGIALTRLRRTAPDRVTADLTAPDFRRLTALADSEEAGHAAIRAVRRRGPAAGWRIFRRRLALLVLPLLLLGLVLASEGFIWEIQVEGTETLSPAEIRWVLAKQGLYCGAARRGLHSEELSCAVLPELPGCAYLSVNFIGSRAVVTVREEHAASAEPTGSVPAEIRAARGGVVRRVLVLEGQSAVQAGERVQPGQLLVPDTADSLSSGRRWVRAAAEIWAETERVYTAAAPLFREEKGAVTGGGRETVLLLWGRRLNLYFNSSIPMADCDKIRTCEALTLWGRTLPLGREVCRWRTRSPGETAETAAEDLLREHLESRLAAELGNGTVLSREYDVRERDGALFVTLRAVCLENIARQIETQPK